MKEFILDDIRIAFAEEEDGENPSFPDDFIKITVEKRKQFKEVLEFVLFFGGDVVNTYVLTDELNKRIISPFKLQEYFEKFSFGSKNRAMVICKYPDEMMDISKVKNFKEKAKEKFSTDDVYFTFLEKVMYEKENEEFLSLELAVINPKIVFFMEKKNEVEEWVLDILKTFRVEFKK